jgi:hypothetical protein
MTTPVPASSSPTHPGVDLAEASSCRPIRYAGSAITSAAVKFVDHDIDTHPASRRFGPETSQRLIGELHRHRRTPFATGSWVIDFWSWRYYTRAATPTSVRTASPDASGETHVALPTTSEALPGFPGRASDLVLYLVAGAVCRSPVVECGTRPKPLHRTGKSDAQDAAHPDAHQPVQRSRHRSELCVPYACR